MGVGGEAKKWVKGSGRYRLSAAESVRDIKDTVQETAVL